ncbi:MAG: dihydrofolate reductase [Hyphomicrobiaceae bacterium]|nr:dihydrofolate reductase [Hyphomicrobiaceae bacterium]
MSDKPARPPVVAFIVAVARNGVIGRDGDLPWRLSSDLKLFRRLTMGKPILMGRKTWAGLKKKPLDGRDNIVLTRDRTFRAEGAIVVHTLDEALGECRKAAARSGADEIMVIGGAEVYRAALSHAERIYWTEVDASPEGDALFPPLDAGAWREIAVEEIERGPKDEHPARLRILERVRA